MSKLETVFDVETDGFDATKIHVLSYQDTTMPAPISMFTLQEMKDFFNQDRIFIGHNIIRFDIPQLKKFICIHKDVTLIDTLPLSWYLKFDRVKHGLDSFHEDYGIAKPVVTDWEGLSPEEYAHRCEEDVKINMALWLDLKKTLVKLYGDDYNNIIKYLNFKMDCAREQEETGIPLDVEAVERHLETLLGQQQEKVKELSEAMPKRTVMKAQNKPKVCFKKDGELSSHGERWFALLKSMKLPESTIGPVMVVDKIEEANPKSPEQVKDWLYSLGWEPCTLKFDRNKKTGEEKQIPQIRNMKGHEREGELCDSVLELAEREPAVKILEGLTIINHRLSVFQSFKDANKDGKIYATIAGLTNTLRFKHSKPFVNLPGVDKPWGAEIRGCLIAPEGYVLCGADMVSLEDTTKRHYIQPHDPKYIAEMSASNYDPHMKLLVVAGEITEDDYNFYVNFDKQSLGSDEARHKRLHNMRKGAKTVNYSSLYGVGVAKLARSMGTSKKKAGILLEAFWESNWAIKKVAKEAYTRNIDGKMWVQNPVSGFYHSLRAEKDIWSTINQSTGTYCFDRWLALCRQNGVVVVFQAHDEKGSLVKVGEEENHEALLKKCMETLNKQLKLNVPLGIDVQFGKNYAETH